MVNIGYSIKIDINKWMIKVRCYVIAVFSSQHCIQWQALHSELSVRATADCFIGTLFNGSEAI